MNPKIRAWLAKALELTFSNSIFLALNGALVFVFASFLYEIQVSFTLAVAAFLITFSVYSLNMATDSQEDAINRSKAAQNKTLYYLVPSVISLVVSIALGIAAGITALLILIAPLLIGFIYSVKIAKSIPRLKEILGVKSVVVALSWAITGAFLPAAIQSVPAYKEIMVFIYIFIQILVNTIIFDTLDIRGDRESGILTVPLALGQKKTQFLLLAFNAFLVVWFICCIFTGIFTEYLLTLGFGIVYESLLIWYFLKTTRPRLQAAILVDGEWVPLVFMLRLLLFR
jgi:4-hydroxybenzoate polyprenyltransferase